MPNPSIPKTDAPQCFEGWQNVSQVAVPGTISQLTCKVDAWPYSYLEVDWTVLSANGRELKFKNGDIVNTQSNIDENIIHYEGSSDIDNYMTP